METVVPPIDPDEFVREVEPLLARKDAAALLMGLKSKWTCEQVMGLLTSPHADAKKVAALALSLVGTRKSVEKLAVLLRDPDVMVNQMAEHALWNIWFRLGATPEANHQLARGAAALERREYQHGLCHFDRAIELDAEFAEAYNQRALGYYLLEEFDDSMRDCRRAVELMPCHFGAWAGLGHCHTHRGELDLAMKSYRRALEINPHLGSIRQAVEALGAR